MKKSNGLNGYDGSRVMNEGQIGKRREADAGKAERGLLKDIAAVQNQSHRPKLEKLRAVDKPMEQPLPDPHADLVKAGGLNPNEPSVESVEPNLVQVQRYSRYQGSQT